MIWFLRAWLLVGGVDLFSLEDEVLETRNIEMFFSSDSLKVVNQSPILMNKIKPVVENISKSCES